MLMASYVPENFHKINLLNLHIFNGTKPDKPATCLDDAPQSGYFLPTFVVREYADG